MDDGPRRRLRCPAPTRPAGGARWPRTKRHWTRCARRNSAFRAALPDDDALLADRVAALAAWCDGFLYGIGSGAPGGDIAKEANISEFLRDLTDIGRAELEPGRNADAAEADFTELFEFVRAGAQLTFDELAQARAHAQG